MLGEANVQTTQASEWLAELCRQFQERAATHPELGIQVAWSESHGSVDFGWGGCTLHARPDSLNLRVEGGPAGGNEGLPELVTRHVERFASGEQAAIALGTHGE